MKKIFSILSLLLLVSTSSFGQEKDEIMGFSGTRFFVEGGVGTSWILLPKVFIVDVTDPENNWQILPATNSITGYVGVQAAIPLSRHWMFSPEIDFTYLSGEIRVDELKTGDVSQKMQTYTRIEVPLNFGVLSNDNFWVSFGPIVYFTLSDNKGFDDAVYELTEDNPTDPTIDSDMPVGLRFRLAAYARINRFFITAKFESDLFQKFEFVDDIYKVRLSMQNITIGLGWRTTEAR